MTERLINVRLGLIGDVNASRQSLRSVCGHSDWNAALSIRPNDVRDWNLAPIRSFAPKGIDSQSHTAKRDVQ